MAIFSFSSSVFDPRALEAKRSGFGESLSWPTHAWGAQRDNNRFIMRMRFNEPIFVKLHYLQSAILDASDSLADASR